MPQSFNYFPRINYSRDPEDTSYKGPQDTYIGSMEDGVKAAFYGTVGGLYNAGVYAGQKLGILDPSAYGAGSYNFADRIQAKEIEISRRSPSTFPFYAADIGSQLGGAIGASVVGGEFISAAGLAVKIGSLSEESAAIAEAASTAEAADPLALKAASRAGVVGRVAGYQALATPVIAGQDISFDKQGNAVLNTQEFLKDTAFGLAAIGSLESLNSAIRRITITKKTIADNALDKLDEVDSEKPKAPEEVKPEEQEKTLAESQFQTETPDSVGLKRDIETEIKQLYTPGGMNQRFINDHFTEAQQKDLFSGKAPARDQEISTDIRMADLALIEDQHVSPDMPLSKARILRQAILTKHGIVINGESASVHDPVAQARIYPYMNRIKAWLGLNGARRVAHTIKLIDHLNALDAEKRIKYNGILDKLFNKQIYRGKGAIENPEAREIQGEDFATPDTPVWYYTAKRGARREEEEAAIRQLHAADKTFSLHAQSLLEESNLGWNRDRYSYFTRNLEDAIENPMSVEEAEAYIADSKAGRGIFAPDSLDEQVQSIGEDILKEEGARFINDEGGSNAFFVKAVKKLSDNLDAAMKYFTCVLGA